MSNEMIERVARVIESISYYVISQHHAKSLARAVIVTMREPTDSYCISILKHLNCEIDDLHINAIKRAHRDMIDEVLK